jgi:hypothetical protein
VTRLAVFGLVVGALFAAALGVGAAVGPIHRGTAKPMSMTMSAAGADGLSVAGNGLRLVPASTTLAAGRTQPFAFRLLDDQGRPLRTYDVEHTKRLHLIVVRRDLTGFQHLHPVLRTDGTWTIPLRLDRPGAYRAVADFSTKGQKTVLGVDLSVPGSAAVHALPASSRSVTTDGYRVELAHDPLAAGSESKLSFRVTRGGRPVTPGPYLGARGHLVVLRQGDLAYSHVHPHDDALDFDAQLPSAGRYRAFLQFSAAGAIHTAAFTLAVPR